MDTSKTSFGFDQLTNPTPEWANWIFRGYFIISKAVVGYLAALAAVQQLHISVQFLMVVTLTITLLFDPIMYGFSKMFGIVPTANDPAQPLIATAQVDDKGNTQAINPVVVPSVDAGTVIQPAPIVPPTEASAAPVIATPAVSSEPAQEAPIVNSPPADPAETVTPAQTALFNQSAANQVAIGQGIAPVVANGNVPTPDPASWNNQVTSSNTP
jgi:hypothetical protein